jgi:hypothetical protein
LNLCVTEALNIDIELCVMGTTVESQRVGVRSHSSYTSFAFCTTVRRGHSVVVLGGDVGGGKSTHAGLLVWYFRQRCGIGAWYAHVKSFHAFSKFTFLLDSNVKLICSGCENSISSE